MEADGDSDLASAQLLHTPKQAARILTIPESWLRRKAGLRSIPCTFVGKHLRFSDADLRAIVRDGTRPANPTTRTVRSVRRLHGVSRRP